MEPNPEILRYARKQTTESISSRTVLASVVTGLFAGTAFLVDLLLWMSLLGAILAILLAAIFGSHIGRRISRISQILLYSGILGFSGALPLLVYVVATYDSSNDFQGLTLFLSVTYSLIAGCVLSMITFVVSLVAIQKD